MSLWTGQFGNDYTQRQQPNLEARMEIWKKLLPTKVHSVLEVGANRGENLEAIRWLNDSEVYATEPNDLAREEMINGGFISPSHVTADFAHRLTWPNGIADCAITCGLLIHIPPEKLLQSMKEIHRCARSFIISGEYFSPSEEMLPYRGHDEALWRRDYGSLWLEHFTDLTCRSCTFAWKPMTGLDNLTFWVMEKKW